MLCSEFQIDAFVSVKLALHSHGFIYYLRKKSTLVAVFWFRNKFNQAQFAIVLAPPPLEKWNYRSAFSILTLTSTVGAESTGTDPVAIEVDCLLSLQAGSNLI